MYLYLQPESVQASSLISGIYSVIILLIDRYPILEQYVARWSAYAHLPRSAIIPDPNIMQQKMYVNRELEDFMALGLRMISCARSSTRPGELALLLI